MNPLVSVIIPNYNHAPYLQQRIESVLNQTYQNIEIFLLDDCSTDNSKDIILSYKNHPKVKRVILNEINSGSTFKQWEKGFLLAKGDYIWIAESDDFCTPNFLEKLISHFNNSTPIAIAYTNSSLIDAHNNIIKANRKKKLKKYHGIEFIKQCMTIGNPIINASSAIFSAKFLKYIPKDYTNFKAVGDYLFWLYLAEQGDVIHVREDLNFFRQHNVKVTSNAVKSGLSFYESLRIYDYLKQKKYIYGINEHITHGYYIWLISHVKGLNNQECKKEVYKQWELKCSHALLNKYIFLIHHVIHKVLTL